MAPDEVTYETLRGRLYRERRNALELVKLDADFYASAERHLHALAEELRREEANPSSPRVLVLHDEVRNLQRVREDLYELRERKILAAAVAAARGGNPDRGALTSAEVDLFESLVRALKEARRTMLRRAVGHELAQAAPMPGVVAPEAPLSVPPASLTPPADPEAPTPAPREEPLVAAERPGSGRLFVKPLEDLPAFTAPDLRTYRLRAGDLAAVPADVARALAGAGKAVVYG